VVARNDIVWASLGAPAGRRPVCVLTRDAAIGVLSALVCVPVTRTARGIRSEVAVADEEGLPEPSVLACDTIITVPKSALESQPVGRLGLVKRAELDRALRYALDIAY